MDKSPAFQKFIQQLATGPGAPGSQQIPTPNPSPRTDTILNPPPTPSPPIQMPNPMAPQPPRVDVQGDNLIYPGGQMPINGMHEDDPKLLQLMALIYGMLNVSDKGRRRTLL